MLASMNVTLAMDAPMRAVRPPAPVRPEWRITGADLRAALSGTKPPDDAFAESIAEAISMVTSEMTNGAAVSAATLFFPA